MISYIAKMLWDSNVSLFVHQNRITKFHRRPHHFCHPPPNILHFSRILPLL